MKVNISLPTLHAAQQKVVNEAKRFNVLACGRRWGKTVIGLDRLVWPALEKKPVGFFSPSYKSLSESWREIKSTLAPITTQCLEAEHRLQLSTGGSVTAWSLDAGVEDLCRGRRYACIIVDEASMIRDLVGVFDRVLRPTLTDYRGSTAWFLSTPRGFDGFYELWKRGKDPTRANWASWQMPTSTNPHIHPEEILDAKRDMAEAAFQQEFEASFIDHAGAVFKNVVELATLHSQAEPEPSASYSFGIDFGRVIDATAIVCLNAKTKHVVFVERLRNMEFHQQRRRIVALADKWQPERIVAETNNIGAVNIEELRRAGIRVKAFVTSSQSKQRLVEQLQLALETRTIQLVNDVNLIAELQSFEAEQLSGGTIRYGARAGAHDDLVIALMLAYDAVAARRRGPSITVLGPNPSPWLPADSWTEANSEMGRIASWPRRLH